MTDTSGRIYQIGEIAKVRNLAGEYQVSERFRVAGRLRYRLVGLPGSLMIPTEAYGEDMQFLRVRMNAPQEPATESPDDAAPGTPNAAADATLTPLAFGNAAEHVAPGAYTHDAGTFGGEPDAYSPETLAPRTNGSRPPIQLTFVNEIPTIEVIHSGKSVRVEFTWS